MTAALAPAPVPRSRLVGPVLVAPSPTELRADRLAARFAERYGGAPAVVTAAPATAVLLGGPSWAAGAATLTTPVDRCALAAVRLVEGGRVELLTDTDVPSGAGLGRRAAERVAVRRALGELGRRDTASWTTAEVAADRGRPGAVLAVGPGTAEASPLRLGRASLLLLDSGLRHLGANPALPSRARATARAAQALAALPEGAGEDDVRAATAGLDATVQRCAAFLREERERLARAATALAAGETAALGAAMTASHRALSRQLRTTTRQLDTTVDAVLAAGACGARMSGAGFGGAGLVLVPWGAEAAVASAAADAAARAGFPPPRALRLAPGETASRVL